MAKASHKSKLELQDLYEKIQLMDLRIKKLEENVSLSKTGTSAGDQSREEEDAYWNLNFKLNESLIESRIGEQGLSWLGNIVLFFGIIFVTQYIKNAGYPAFSVILGYGLVMGIFIVSKLVARSYSHLAFRFRMTAFVLLYYMTMSLHFFSADPLIENKWMGLIPVLPVLGLMTGIAFRERSQVYAGLALIFLFITAVSSDATHLTLAFATLASALGLYFYCRYEWKGSIIFTLIFSYIIFLIWFFGNPIMGNTWAAREHAEYGYLYLFVNGLVYSLLPLLNRKRPESEGSITGMIILNGLMFSLVLGLFTLEFFMDDFIGLFWVITFMCLAISILIKNYSGWKFASAFYALYGFLAMSIAIYGMYQLPKSYFLLSLQSLLVVSMALWLRNRIIVYMNAMLFTILLVAYLVSASHTDGINYSFAFVALITARILNWRKERLEIKTDGLRNIYLILGFFVVLYALYHSVPPNYITLSWTLAALLYFLFSIILKNVKYRYMALGTMVAAAGYFFIVDLANIDLIFRILALLVLAIISIGVSTYYTRNVKKSVNNE